MTRKAPFWILFALVSAGALAFAVSNFTRTFPIVSLPLSMDRAGALAAARDLAHRHALGAGGRVREAASFGVDDTVKTFVELEGGGADAFRAMLRDHLYDAYTWQVRQFREGETRELLIRFRPDGEPVGFWDKLREDAPGAALAPDQARAIAEASAARDWRLDLAPYDRVETSTERRPGGRVDHAFTYERRDARAGEGRYRVRLVVSGDRLTALTRFLQVPEAFSRRYEKLRSSNNAIAFGAVVAMALLYVVCGCLIGVFLLLKRRQLWWTPAMTWGFGIAGLMALAGVNAWPLAWMEYDTAVSGGAFLTQRILATVLGFVADGSLVALTLAAAEGLGRQAFPNHPQLWKLWSRDAAASREVAGRTVGGTLITGLEFGYIIAFYLLVTRLWKWWVPAESLVEPDILATYVPWLSAVAPSLHAGVWEEAMFRAIPLAGAALIGNRFGKRKLWIAIGLVVEAVVFGSAHANYPSEPAYSRPLELIVPSLVWGLVYLRYGLLTSIVAHYLFDLSLFSIPLFTSTAARSIIDRVVVIACGALPLLVVARAALRRRGLVELPASLWNRAWSPSLEEPELPVVLPVAPASDWPRARTGVVVAAGAAGLIAFVLLTSWSPEAPRLALRRPAAIAEGVRALAVRGVSAEARWKRLAAVDTDDEQTEFAWRALGEKVYRSLVGDDIQPPGWSLRVASFSGDVAERAEEWHAWLGGDGTPWRLRHVLPEGRAGATLDETAARSRAHGELARAFQADPACVREVSAVSSRHPKRLDWTFTFEDTARPRLARGERRIVVEVAGDRVTDAHRLVFVPEDWQRSERHDRAILGVLSIVRGFAFALVMIAAATLGVLAWSRGRFPVAFAVRLAVIALVIGVGAAALRWPALESQFSTAQPFQLQTAIAAIALGVIQLLASGLMALVVGYGIRSVGAPSGSRGAPMLAGIGAGALAAGALALVARAFPAAAPSFDAYGPAASPLPWLLDALRLATQLLSGGMLLLALLALGREVARRGSRGQLGATVALFVVGGLIVTPASPATAGAWLLQAALAGAALVVLERWVLRHDARLAVPVVATMCALRGAHLLALRVHPDAALGGALGIVLVVALAAWWWRELRNVPGIEAAHVAPEEQASATAS